MLFFNPPENQTLVNIVQTQNKLYTVNGIYEGCIASELKEHYYVVEEIQSENLNGPFWQTRLIKIKPPTEDYLSAIDAVNKAHASLEAAKKCLQLLQESN